MRRLRALGASPFALSIVVLGGLVVAGFASFVITWAAMAPHGQVVNQIPFLISGGFGGLALIAVGCGMLALQHRRLIDAEERQEFDRLIDVAGALLESSR